MTHKGDKVPFDETEKAVANVREHVRVAVEEEGMTETAAITAVLEMLLIRRQEQEADPYYHKRLQEQIDNEPFEAGRE